MAEEQDTTTGVKPPDTQTALELERLRDDLGGATTPGNGTQQPPGATAQALEGQLMPRPWKPWVGLAESLITEYCDGWDWRSESHVVETEQGNIDFDGRRLFFDGIEKQLTIWMPNGLIDIEKYPVIMTGIGLAILYLRNSQMVVDEKGNKVRRVKPLFKEEAPPAKPSTVATRDGNPQPGGTVQITPEQSE